MIPRAKSNQTISMQNNHSRSCISQPAQKFHVTSSKTYASRSGTQTPNDRADSRTLALWIMLVNASFHFFIISIDFRNKSSNSSDAPAPTAELTAASAVLRREPRLIRAETTSFSTSFVGVAAAALYSWGWQDRSARLRST